MSDLVERLRDDNSDYVYTERHEAAARITELETERIGLLQANLEANTQLARVTLKKRNLETARAEAEGQVIADVVKWLRDQATCGCGRDDCIADNYPNSYATALETGEWKK